MDLSAKQVVSMLDSNYHRSFLSKTPPPGTDWTTHLIDECRRLHGCERLLIVFPHHDIGDIRDMLNEVADSGQPYNLIFNDTANISIFDDGTIRNLVENLVYSIVYSNKMDPDVHQQVGHIRNAIIVSNYEFNSYINNRVVHFDITAP